jgi:hypothetical protein
VVALLNDLFGIQARGGCSCAGPYGHRLLGIDLTTSRSFGCAIVAGYEGIKPGWVRVNFNYFISEGVFQYLLDAVEFVAEHGWKLLPHYTFDVATGIWKHKRFRPDVALRLTDVTYRSGKLEYRSRSAIEPEWALPTYLNDAQRIVAEVASEYAALDVRDPPLPVDIESLRWFPLPSEVVADPERHGEGRAAQPIHV